MIEVEHASPAWLVLKRPITPGHERHLIPPARPFATGPEEYGEWSRGCPGNLGGLAVFIVTAGRRTGLPTSMDRVTDSEPAT
jgi:hypothetical protein